MLQFPVRHLLFFLLLASAARATAVEQPITISPWIAAPGAVLAATGTGFQPGARAVVWGGGPYTENFIEVPNGVSFIASAFGHLYTFENPLAGGNVIHIYSLDDPANPTLVNSLGAGARVDHLLIVGTLAYLADSVGLSIYDLAQPANPTLLSTTPLPAARLTVSNGYAYVIGRSGAVGAVSRLSVVDVSNPALPVLVEEKNFVGGSERLDLVGDYLLASEHRIYDISDPTNLVWLGDAPFVGQDGYSPPGWGPPMKFVDSIGFDLRGQEAPGNAGGATNHLQIIDFSNPFQPVALGTLNLDGVFKYMNVSGDRVYAMADHGLVTIDVSDLLQPRVLSIEPRDKNDTQTFAHQVQDRVYVGYPYFGIQVINMRRAERPGLVVGELKGGVFNNLPISGDYAYGGTTTFGESAVFDISDTADPVVASTHEQAGSLYKGFVQGDYMYAGASGLTIWDISDPLLPLFVGELEVQEDMDAKAVSGDYVYLSETQTDSQPYSKAIRVVDVTAPAAPVVVASLDLTADWRDVEAMVVDGDTLYVQGRSMLHIVDVTDPLNPVLISETLLSGLVLGGGDMAYADGHLYVTGGLYLSVVDVSNPTAPFILSQLDVWGASRITIDSQFAYLTGENSGVHVVDMSDPAAPVLINGFSTMGESLGVGFHDGLVVLADRTALRFLYATEALSANVSSSTSLTLSLPDYLPGGSYDVVVINPDGTIYRHRNGIFVMEITPELDMSGLVDGTYINSPTLTMEGTATDSWRGDTGITEVAVDGVPIPGSSAAGGHTALWSTLLSLVPGQNHTRIVATDGDVPPRRTVVGLDLHYIPFVADTDGDGLGDDFEVAIGTDPAVIDTDGDGRSDADELSYDGNGSYYNPTTDISPLRFDSDRDGSGDGAEIDEGTDPLDPLSVPAGC